MKSVAEKNLKFNKGIKVNFEGGNLTSDAGLILYKEFDEKIGLSETIKKNVSVNDAVNHHTHSNEDVMIQKIYQHIAGHHTDDHADELSNEPLLTTLLDKERLASQPTFSRLNQKFDKETMKQVQNTNDELIDRVQENKPSDHFVFDLDSANFTTCGNQYGHNFNAHYQSHGFHPLFLFDGITGDCLKGVLRAGNVYTSRNVVGFVGPTIRHYKKTFPWATLTIRGDSGFAVPGLYELCEEHETSYAIRLKANKKLTTKAQELENQLRERTTIHSAAPYVFYKEFSYKAGSWDRSRRVVVKLEKPAGDMFFHYTFVVTNMAVRPKFVLKFYQNRGTMENFIKEGKNGFAFDQLSSPDFYTNATKLQVSILAYNFANWLNRLCLPQKMKGKRIETMRTQIIKIAGKVIRSGRYTVVKLCSSCLYQKEFWKTLLNIQKLPSFQ